MEMLHEAVKVGRDENGIFLTIKFTKDMIEKVYLEEIFDDYAEAEELIDISVKTHSSGHSRLRPPALYESLDPKEITRVKEALDLRPVYRPVRDDLNVFKQLTHLLEENPPDMAWSASSPKEHEQWANKVRELVSRLTHFNQPKVPLEVEKGPSTTLKGVSLQKLYITTAKYQKVPAILAKPIDLNEPVPAMICVHGHNKGKINTIGMLESSSNSYYGMDLALRGYVTLSLDQWGWGEREGYHNKTESRAEEVFSLSALLLGYTAIGFRCWDVSRSIDYLSGLDEVNGKYGVIGQSGGGTTAAFSSVLDPRLDASVVSGYFCSWRHSTFAMHHCACNHVPGIMQHLDLPDIMAARAPQPTFIVSGDRDPIFPQVGVQLGYRKLKEVYAMLGKEGNLGIDVIPNTGHVFRGDHAYPWLDEVLEFNAP